MQLNYRHHNHLTRDLHSFMARLWGLPLAPLLVLGYLSDRVLGVGPWTVPLAFLAVLLLSRVFLRSVGLLARKTGPVGSLPEIQASELSDRLSCSGTVEELQRVAGIGAGFFEPVIIRFASIGRNKTQWIMIVVGFAALYTSDRILGLGPIVGAFSTVCITLLASAVPYSANSYYRVYPGYLEIISFPLFGGRAKYFRSVPLWEAVITCRFDAQALVIVSPLESPDAAGGSQVADQDTEEVSIDLSATIEPHRLCEAVFQAAITKCPTPELPKDELLG